MQYRYGAKEKFDATKQSLNKPAAGASPNPRPLLDAMNYGASFPGFRSKVKFRSKQGNQLRTGVAPLYVGGRPLHDSAQSQGGANSGIDDDYAGTDDTEQQPDASTRPAGFPFISDAPAVPVDKPKISTPVAAGLLGMAVAIAVGIGIASSNSFDLKPAGLAGDDPLAGEPAAATGAQPASLTGGAISSATTRKTAPATALAQPAAAPASTASANDQSSSGASQEESSVASTSDARQPTPDEHVLDAVASKPAAPAKPKKSVKQASNTPRASDAPSKPRQARRKTATESPASAPSRSAPASKPYSDREPSYTADARTTTRARYERCEQVAGLFKREQCKWRVCGNKWGYDGCPAYKHPKGNPMIGAMLADERRRALRLKKQDIEAALNQA